MARWIIDPDHSVAAFSVRHLMIARVHGQFNRLAGTMLFDNEKQSGFSLELIIDAAGIYTGIAKRDDHLRSPDFFDVAKFPTLTFRSTGFEARENYQALVTGDLTIHGVARAVKLEAEFSGPVKTPEDLGGEMTIGLSAATTINREDFGIVWNVPLQGDGVMVGRDIDISLEIEADLAG